MRLIILLLFVFLCSARVLAQEPYQTIRFDTVYLKQGFILTVNNRSYISSRDTVLYIASTVPYKIKREKGNGFYERLDSTAQYSRLIRELRNMVLVNRRRGISVDNESTTKSETNFIPYQNKIIRKITFRQLDVFGPTISDTTATANSWIEKTGNRLHFKTRNYLLRNNLIINEGDALDPLKIADNERLLREAPYIHDAKIYVKELAPQSDSVDLVIVVKDVWSKAFDLRIDNLYGGNFSIWDRNIFGFGHAIQNSIYWDKDEQSNLGYEGVYNIPNIGGSFIRGRGQYLNKFGNETYGLSFDRNFYTPNTKYAGGLSIYKTKKSDYFSYPDTLLLAPVEYTKSDFWLGRSFPLNSSNFKSRNNLSFTLRVTNTNINQRPVLSEDQFYNYHNRTLYLSSISFNQQNYIKSNLIYNFGRTEDIPYGLQFELTGGFETNEFKNRSFLGAKFGWANYKENVGYMHFSAGHEGFTNVDKKIEQGLVFVQFNHFTPLIRYKRLKFRHFIDIDYTKGINRYMDEYLTLNEPNGLKGFVNDSLRGNERLKFHFETVCFSPFYFYEFRFVFFASAELSIFGKSKDILNNPLYSGFSLGVRIRNERLVFNTLELRFNLYPNKPPYSKTQFFNLSGEQVLSPPSFLTKPPTISNYR